MTGPNYFGRDHVIRDAKNRPLGRVVLVEDFVEKVDLKLVLAKVPRSYLESLDGEIVYINQEPYQFPEEISPVRKSSTDINVFVNTVILKYIGDKDEDTGA